MKQTQIDELKQELGLNGVPATDQDMQTIQAMHRARLEAFGEPSASKEQAAAYGAGCLIIAASLGLNITATITPVPNGAPHTWKAESTLALTTLEHCYNDEADPKDVVRSAMQCLAGFVGEIIKGLGHENSALQMRGNAAQYAAYLDHVHGLAPNTFFMRLIDLVRGALVFNASVFEELFTRLLSDETIDYAALDRQAFSVPLVNLNQLFGSLQ